MPLGDNDLGVFFNEFAVPVVFGGQAARGNFDAPSDEFAFGSGPSTMEQQCYSVTLPYNAFSTVPKSKDSISVGGKNYTVKARKYSQDGKIMTLELLNVTESGSAD